MKRTFRTTVVIAALAAGAAYAHAEVSNADVKARMDLMGDIRKNFATLGGMVQGKTDFDADAANAAANALVTDAEGIPAAFETPAMDPESEASPAIWENWDDFVAKARNLEMAADNLDTSSLEALKASFGPAGAACGSCHKAYRVD